MSNIQELRKYIIEECEKNGEISLLNAFAKYDFYQHDIPTLNQVRRAIEKIEGVVTYRENGEIIIKTSNSPSSFDPNTIVEQDIKNTYKQYIESIKQ